MKRGSAINNTNNIHIGVWMSRQCSLSEVAYRGMHWRGQEVPSHASAARCSGTSGAGAGGRLEPRSLRALALPAPRPAPLAAAALATHTLAPLPRACPQRELSDSRAQSAIISFYLNQSRERQVQLGSPLAATASRYLESQTALKLLIRPRRHS